MTTEYTETVKRRRALPVFVPGPCVSRLATGCTGYERPSTPGLCRLCAYAEAILKPEEWPNFPV